MFYYYTLKEHYLSGESFYQIVSCVQIQNWKKNIQFVTILPVFHPYRFISAMLMLDRRLDV